MIVLSACGAKSQEAVTKDLEAKIEKMKSYKVGAKMSIKVGEEPQIYLIDIWHRKPEEYKVQLKNEKKDQSQIILRNKKGVFVLTPALNKSYRFQNEWPKQTSQAYLYESLVKDIVEDAEAEFEVTDKHYVFKTKTRYPNNAILPRQEVKFRKDTLEPVSVSVFDTDQEPLVHVEFERMEFDAKFDDDSFETKKSMTSAQIEVPVLAQNDERTFQAKYVPEHVIDATLIDEMKVENDEGMRILLTYGGDSSFTFIQEQFDVVPSANMLEMKVNGKMVDLGFTIGVLTDNSLSWFDQGVEYTLISDELNAGELQEIAQSVQSFSEK